MYGYKNSLSNKKLDFKFAIFYKDDNFWYSHLQWSLVKADTIGWEITDSLIYVTVHSNYTTMLVKDLPVPEQVQSYLLSILWAQLTLNIDSVFKT